MLSVFAEKKKPVLTIKNGIFQSLKNPLFQRKTHICFWSKNAIFPLVRFGQNKTRDNA